MRPLVLFSLALALLSSCGDDTTVDAGVVPDGGDAGIDGSRPDAADAAGDVGADGGDSGMDAEPPADSGRVDADAAPPDAAPTDAPSADGAPIDGSIDTSPPGPMCSAGTLDCTTAPGCETSATDPSNCGGCGVTCAWSTCSAAGCDPIALDSGVNVTCGRRASGALHCWGISPGSALAGTIGAVDHDVDYDDGGCAVLGTGELLCWSRTGAPSLVAGVTDAVEVASSSRSVCIRRTGGTVACAPDVGMSFRDVGGVTNATGLASGFLYMCAALSDGTARCWGDNTYGSLGDGTMTTSFTPVVVDGVTDIAALDSSRRHVCARTRGGQLYCWGDNSNGQVGTGGIGFAPTPSLVGSFTDVIDVACGDDHTCVARATGEVVCWGSNRNGKLGLGTIGGADVRRPGASVVGISAARAVATGENHTCALRASGAFCWGEGSRRQLGDGGSADSATPVAVLAPP